MKIVKYGSEENTTNAGNLCLWYGKSGVGKSASLLQSAKSPMLYIVAERGQVELTVKAIGREGLELYVAYYDGWDDLLEFLYTVDNFNGIKSVVFDSLTHVMSIHLADEIMSENYEASDKKKKSDKDLTSRVKMTIESYGVMSKQMGRLMKAFENITKMGIDVHCTARDDSQPKWNRELACAPALSGKEFSRDMKGYFDFIGMIESNLDEHGKVSYPPLVSCDDNGNYLSKWTGIKPEGGVIQKIFNVERLLDVAHGNTAVK